MTSEYLLRFAVAALLGAVLGAEREFRDKAAGLRTIMLICIGSCLFTIMGQELITPERGDPVRIASAIVSGVGFLGAGVIFRRGKQSTGITTAATIWCAAALGMACGGGQFSIALTVGALMIAILVVLPPLERLIDAQRESQSYHLKTRLGGISVAELHQLFTDANLKVIGCSHGKKGDVMITDFDVIGKHDAHAAIAHQLLDADFTNEFSS